MALKSEARRGGATGKAGLGACLLAVGSIVSAPVPTHAGDGGGRDFVIMVGSPEFADIVEPAFDAYWNAGLSRPEFESFAAGGGLEVFCAGIGAGFPDALGASRRMQPADYGTCASNGVADVAEVFLGRIPSSDTPGAMVPAYLYVKLAHLGVIPDLDTIAEVFNRPDAIGPQGYLSTTGLVPPDGAELAAQRAAAVDLQPLDPSVLQTQPPAGAEPLPPQQAVAPAPETAPASAPQSEDAVELAFWRSVEDSDDPRDFSAYLSRYPQGAFAPLARNRLQRLVAAQSGGGAPPAPGAADLGPRYALVIGNAEYGPGMGALRNPVNDARLVAETLTAVGFAVTLHKDLPLRDMRRAVRDFGRVLRAADRGAVALFYFSGHGVQARGQNFLVPIDAQIEAEGDVALEAVSATAILQQMEESGAETNLLLLDACRNSPFTREFRSATRGLAPMDAQSGTMIAYATRPGAVAYDGEGANSPFTLALRDAMLQEGEPVELAMKDVARSVSRSTGGAQTPWVEGILLEDFYFIPPG